VFGEVCNLDGERLVRKRRMVFAKDSEPEIKTRNLTPDTLVHVLGMPRISLALVDWRRREAAREGGNRDVLNWGLPYEIMVVGYYGEIQDEDAPAPTAMRVMRNGNSRGTFIPREVRPNELRQRVFNETDRK
jgi:hypothetical protein